MRALYIECTMGAAGDMLMSALCEIHPDSDDFIKRINKLNIQGVKVTKNKSEKCGITGTHINVSVDGVCENNHMHGHHNHEHHAHTTFNDIKNIVAGFDLSQKVKNDILSVYKLIAEAEGFVHGKPAEQIHFHEVGTMDALTDITGVCMLINELGPEQIFVSPVCVGSGTVKCAHGTLPVPAPATAYILKDVPIYSGSIKSELCTPTGAALLKYFADKFIDMPVMKILKIGYGMGTKDFENANCVRAILGEIKEKEDIVVELNCNLDDMTGEETAFAVERLFSAGALEVFTTPVNMKKNRPGIMLTCLCPEKLENEMISLIFKNTSTIGVRKNICERYVMSRSEEKIKTSLGYVNIKTSKGYGTEKTKADYDDVAKIASENNLSLREVRNLIEGEVLRRGDKKKI